MLKLARKTVTNIQHNIIFKGFNWKQSRVTLFQVSFKYWKQTPNFNNCCLSKHTCLLSGLYMWPFNASYIILGPIIPYASAVCAYAVQVKGCRRLLSISPPPPNNSHKSN